MTTSPAEVQAQLERILASPIFSASARSVQFLRFCVEQSLQGNHDQIKESTVAVEVFGRTPNYDPKTDPIVRVQAKRLRDKLDHYYADQGADDPIHITIPKGGYVPQAVRKLPKAKVDFSDWCLDMESPARAVHIEPGAESERAGRRISFPLTLALIALTIIIGSVAVIRSRTASTRSLYTEGEPLPLNAAPGRERNPTWSPDGAVLAFSWDGGSQSSPRIYLQRVGEAQPYRLTRSDQPEYRPAWSPDGKQIAFVRYVDSGHFEVVQKLLSEDAEKSDGVFSYNWGLPDDQPALDWSPDGKSLLVAEQPSDASPFRLLLVNVASGKRKLLTDPPAGTSGDIDGKFSPDGSLVAFRRGGLGDLYVVSIVGEADHPARRLTPNNPGIRGIAWSRDGQHILFGSLKGGFGWAIWQVGLHSGSPAPLLMGDFDAVSLAISPDGSQLAVEREDHITNLRKIDLAGNEKGVPARWLAPSDRQDFSPVYSPSGEQVVFISTRSGPRELWLENSKDGTVRQLTHLTGTGFPLTPSWSPDGTKIIFALRKNGPTNLVVIDAESGATRQITSSASRYFSPVYSADGRFIYFNSNSDGLGRVWRMAADGTGNPEPMFWDVPGVFRNSGDGKSIFFRDSEPELHIARRDLSTGLLQTIFSSDKRLSSYEGLCVHDRTVYLLLSPIRNPLRSDLVAIQADTGKTSSIAHFDQSPPGMESGCSVSPNGQTILVTSAQRDESDIYLVKINSR